MLTRRPLPIKSNAVVSTRLLANTRSGVTTVASSSRRLVNTGHPTRLGCVTLAGSRSRTTPSARLSFPPCYLQLPTALGHPRLCFPAASTGLQPSVRPLALLLPYRALPERAGAAHIADKEDLDPIEDFFTGASRRDPRVEVGQSRNDAFLPRELGAAPRCRPDALRVTVAVLQLGDDNTACVLGVGASIELREIRREEEARAQRLRAAQA